ncbi:MAG: nickel pincer cofactor biosynthesis protein LarC [Anaerolineales bacterium]
MKDTPHNPTLAYFDCIGGASGDMLLGALLDAGLPPERLRADLDSLHLPGFDLEIRTVYRQGFRATKVDVRVLDERTERHLPEIEAVIRESTLPSALQERAVRVFARLGTAEGRIHGLPPEKVHLHELGGLDTIVDVVGVLSGLDALGVTEIHASPLPLGSGMTRGAHGRIPLPAPATLALLEGIPIEGRAAPGETVTPTGAALLSELVSHWGPIPPMRLAAVGYGAGGRDTETPNLVRVLLGTPPAATVSDSDYVVQLSTNLDDAMPEEIGYAQEILLQAGALDVTCIPALMKKNRPAVILQVLCRPQDADRLRNLVLRETPTLGVRTETIRRHTLRREIRTVPTPWGTVRVKIAELPDGSQRPVPEYEDCRRLAQAHDIPLRRVYQAAQQSSQTTAPGPPQI